MLRYCISQASNLSSVWASSLRYKTLRTLARNISTNINNHFNAAMSSHSQGVTSADPSMKLTGAAESSTVDGDANGVPGSVQDAGGKLLQKVLDIVLRERLVTGIDGSKKVTEFRHPEELMKLLALGVGEAGRTLEEAEEVMEQVVKYSVKTAHPHFYNQQYAGVDEVALMAAWLTEALNTNQHTFEVAPVFILVEHFIISLLVEMFGWPEGDGIFSPGGSMSHMSAMVLARYQRNPEVKTKGNVGMKPLVLFTSDQSHYSFKKAAGWMGLGTDNVVSVKTDSHGRMLPQVLRQEIQAARARGGEPYFVNACAATTVLGAFDPIDQVADVCQEEGLWLHVDACWGGAVILSETHKHLLHGVHRADSVSWNPHKMLGVNIQCSTLIVRHKGLLHQCNSASATYLFQQDKFYDVSYDTGDKSFQCGRKADAVKLYLLLSFHGLQEIQKRIDQAFSAAKYLSDQIASRPGFRKVLEEPQCTNTCFWYIPPSLRGLPETRDWWNKLDKVAPQLKARMVEEGTMMIGYQPLPNKNLVNFLRMINTSYPPSTKADMDFVLDYIEKLGADL